MGEPVFCAELFYGIACFSKKERSEKMAPNSNELRFTTSNKLQQLLIILIVKLLNFRPAFVFILSTKADTLIRDN